VVDVLSAFGWQGSRSTIYRDVQAAGEAVARRQQAPRRVQVVSADATYLVCKGEEITVAVALDALAGEVIEVEIVDGESADALRPFLQRLQQEYGMEVLVSDDQDSYKVLADELGLEHSICRAHVNRNVARLVAELAQQATATATSPPAGVTRTPEELLADLEYCQLLIALRPADGERQLLHLYRYYQAAPAPPKGQKASIWYPGAFGRALPSYVGRTTGDASPLTKFGIDSISSGWMAPIMSQNVQLAVGSKNAIAACAPTSDSPLSPTCRASFPI
jgi:hypothetical protein